jgi:hypothetical protein
MTDVDPTMNQLLRRRRSNPHRRAIEDRLARGRDATDPAAFAPPEDKGGGIAPPPRVTEAELGTPPALRRGPEWDMAETGETFRVYDLDELFGKERKDR